MVLFAFDRNDGATTSTRRLLKLTESLSRRHFPTFSPRERHVAVECMAARTASRRNCQNVSRLPEIAVARNRLNRPGAGNRSWLCALLTSAKSQLRDLPCACRRFGSITYPQSFGSNIANASLRCKETAPSFLG